MPVGLAADLGRVAPDTRGVAWVAVLAWRRGVCGGEAHPAPTRPAAQLLPLGGRCQRWEGPAPFTVFSVERLGSVGEEASLSALLTGRVFPETGTQCLWLCLGPHSALSLSSC